MQLLYSLLTFLFVLILWWYSCRELPGELVTVINHLRKVLGTDRRVTEAYLQIMTAYGHPPPFRTKETFEIWVSIP